MPSAQGQRRRVFLVVLVLIAALAAIVVSSELCVSAYLFDGVVAHKCPEGRMRQTLALDAWSLHRGAPTGLVRIGATANYTTREADALLTAPIRRFTADLSLVKPNGAVSPLVPEKGWKSENDHAKTGQIALPDVLDGDYLLRAHVKSPLGEDTLDVPLPIYSPARIHVITDRPLYQPGNTVQFRAVALRARDLSPLDGRPGRWMVLDPQGETVFEEKSPAQDFGVASGSFPLDDGAPTGDWHVRWISGGAMDDVSFRVEPFTLPRFRVEASAPKPFYRAHEKPTVRGKATYSSGAPVSNAEIDVHWSTGGAWPPPTSWTSGPHPLLPEHVTADKSGNFELKLPEIPKDLKGKVTLSASLSAVDSAGDRVEGAASILLAEDAIDVQTVTELEDGLVQGFNNRLYLRAGTAAGGVLPSTKLVIKRGWQPGDKGIEAITDEDGVAAIQIDPGPPVNVVIPPMPYRPVARTPAVSLSSADELISGQPPSLADRRAIESWNGALASCARFVDQETGSARLYLHADPAGAIVEMAGDASPLADCARAALKGKKLTPGKHRVVDLRYDFGADLPKLTAEVAGQNPPEVFRAALNAALLDARSCLPRSIGMAALNSAMVYSADVERGRVAISFAPHPAQVEDLRVPEPVERCVEDKLKAIHIPKSKLASKGPAEENEDGEEGGASRTIGVVHFEVQPSAQEAQERPQATTMLGYELKVEAVGQGSTKVLLRPGNVPAVRLRAQPVLAEAGGEVDVTLIRGPSFTDKLPDALHLTHERGSIEGKLDPKTRTAHFKLPPDAKGWFAAEWGGGRAFVYVRPKAELRVSVTPKKSEYAPGEDAELGILTTSGDRGTKAAVGLFGVDQSLGQLVSLPGPDAMARIRPKATMGSNAFGVLDAEALAMGRIRGANAAAATILRVIAAPAPPEVEATMSASAHPSFEPLEALTDHFYAVLTELYAEERAWEERAPKDEQMQPKTMAKLWESALDACEKKKIDVTDAYGRRLRLYRLPADLLALTDPRQIVINGTRLPEDIENWARWVAKERP